MARGPAVQGEVAPAPVRRTERVGVSGAIRFLMQYDPGHGDYTVERRGIIADLTLDQAVAEIKARPSEHE